MNKAITNSRGEVEYTELTALEVAAIEAQRIIDIEAAKPQKVTSLIETKYGTVMVETTGDLSKAFTDEVITQGWTYPTRTMRVFMKNVDYIAMLKVAPELAVMVRDLAIPTEQLDGGEFIYLEELLIEHKQLMLGFNAIIETKQ